jgi:phosphoglycerol transferase MdoB-like AlkP superfamily enzyme
MDPLAYLTTPAAAGTLEWVFFVAQIVVAIAGVYLAFMYSEPHPIRGRAVRQLAYALLAVGVVGAVVGALRISGVMPFTMPLWITVATLFNLVLLVFALYYARSVLPEQVAAYDQAQRGRTARDAARPGAVDASRAAPRPTPENSNVVAAPRPPSGRRDARRDRKRKAR